MPEKHLRQKRKGNTSSTGGSVGRRALRKQVLGRIPLDKELRASVVDGIRKLRDDDAYRLAERLSGALDDLPVAVKELRASIAEAEARAQIPAQHRPTILTISLPSQFEDLRPRFTEQGLELGMQVQFVTIEQNPDLVVRTERASLTSFAWIGPMRPVQIARSTAGLQKPHVAKFVNALSWLTRQKI